MKRPYFDSLEPLDLLGSWGIREAMQLQASMVNRAHWRRIRLPEEIASSIPDIEDDTQRNWTYLAREFVKDIKGIPVEPYPTFREGSQYQQIIDLIRRNDRWVDVGALP